MPTYKEPFHYSLSLESAMRQLCGSKSKWASAAGVFHSPAEVREALEDAVKRIRHVLDDLSTADERLLFTTNGTLDTLVTHIRDYNETSNNEIDIISALIKLVAYLLGHDWNMGKPNRQVAYYQTGEQVALDDARHPEYIGSKWYDVELEKRREIIVNLHKEGLRAKQISRVMSVPEAQVKNYLVRSGLIARKDNTEQT